MELHIWTNGTDYVIAHSKDDAMLLCSEYTGETLDDIAEYWDGEEVRAIPDDEPFTVWDWEDRFENPDAAVTKIAHEWVADQGRTYLACTEY